MASIDQRQSDQFNEIIGKSQRILIALPANPSADALSSSLALAGFLRKLDKQVELYSQKANFEELSFLSGVEQIKHEILLPRSMVITLRTDHAQLDELSYDALPDRVKIFLKPKQGSFVEQDISLSSESVGFDLIVLLATPSLELLGALYERNAESFFNTPKINIDNHINNENYANLNIVDVVASSSAEVLYDLLKRRKSAALDENIATALLTGIISATNSFQNNKTTPDSFLKASELISVGGKQQEIIKNLFKTKELSVLKLLGRAMARIKPLPEFSGMISLLTLQDVSKSGASENDILKAAEDLVASVSDPKILFLVIERQERLEAFVSSNPNVKLEELVNYFGGGFISNNFAKIVIKDKNIAEAEQIILAALKDLKLRIGL